MIIFFLQCLSTFWKYPYCPNPNSNTSTELPCMQHRNDDQQNQQRWWVVHNWFSSTGKWHRRRTHINLLESESFSGHNKTTYPVPESLSFRRTLFSSTFFASFIFFWPAKLYYSSWIDGFVFYIEGIVMHEWPHIMMIRTYIPN